MFAERRGCSDEITIEKEANLAVGVLPHGRHPDARVSARNRKRSLRLPCWRGNSHDRIAAASRKGYVL